MTIQHLEALRVANVERAKKAKEKQALADGADPAELIRTTERSFTVNELVGAVPGFGAVKVRKVCNLSNVRAERRVRDLTETERERIAVIVSDMLTLKRNRQAYQRRYQRGELIA